MRGSRTSRGGNCGWRPVVHGIKRGGVMALRGAGVVNSRRGFLRGKAHVLRLTSRVASLKSAGNTLALPYPLLSCIINLLRGRTSMVDRGLRSSPDAAYGG